VDIDTLTGPAAPVEHCGRPMRWKGTSTSWEGKPGHGFELNSTDWTCDCGATLHVEIKVPS